jgi:ATP-binding cassette subfamily C protein CydC
MASLGAADHLAERTLHRLATFEANRSRNALTRALATGLARALAAAAVAGVVVAASRGGADVAMLVLIALLAAGVVASAERLVSAADAARASRRADARLNAVASHHPARHSGGPAFFAAYTDDGLRVAGYWLTETPLRAGRSLDFAVAPGETLVVTGASGGGKTTLLDVIETALRQPVTGPSPGRLTAVLADDYVFTGTVASNLRLANPALTHDDIKGLLADMVLDRNGLEPTTAVGVGGRGLSGGEQRRLHIARAVATKPDVLLVDEPTTGLDGTTATHVLAALRRRLPHAVVVLTMHEPPADRGVLDRAVSTLSLD